MKHLILALLLAVSVTSCEKDWSKAPEGVVTTSTKHSQLTPQGSVVFSKNGVSADQLVQVDTALSGLVKDLPPEYGVTKLNLTVYLPADGCVLSPVNHTPSWKMRSDAYDGTSFDQYNTKGEGVKDGVGVIYAAEMVDNLDGMSIISCAEDGFSNGNSVRYGGEHIIAYMLDKDYFFKTWYHGNGISHPLYPRIELPVSDKIIQTHPSTTIVGATK